MRGRDNSSASICPHIPRSHSSSAPHSRPPQRSGRARISYLQRAEVQASGASAPLLRAIWTLPLMQAWQPQRAGRLLAAGARGPLPVGRPHTAWSCCPPFGQGCALLGANVLRVSVLDLEWPLPLSLRRPTMSTRRVALSLRTPVVISSKRTSRRTRKSKKAIKTVDKTCRRRNFQAVQICKHFLAILSPVERSPSELGAVRRFCVSCRVRRARNIYSKCARVLRECRDAHARPRAPRFFLS